MFQGHGVEASAETPFYAIFMVCATLSEILGALVFFSIVN
jgi:hypothetical protein